MVRRLSVWDILYVSLPASNAASTPRDVISVSVNEERSLLSVCWTISLLPDRRGSLLSCLLFCDSVYECIPGILTALDYRTCFVDLLALQSLHFECSFVVSMRASVPVLFLCFATSRARFSASCVLALGPSVSMFMVPELGTMSLR